MKEELFELKLQGYCCSQMVMEMGLRALGKQNEDLIEAISEMLTARSPAECLRQPSVCCILQIPRQDPKMPQTLRTGLRTPLVIKSAAILWRDSLSTRLKNAPL